MFKFKKSDNLRSAVTLQITNYSSKIYVLQILNEFYVKNDLSLLKHPPSLDMMISHNYFLYVCDNCLHYLLTG